GRRAIRRWAKGGRGRPTDMAIERGWVTHLATYGKSGIAYTNTQPALGILNGSTGAGFVRRPVVADFRELGERFLISPDGKTVALAFEPWGGKPAVLSIAERRLTPGAPSAGHGLLAPITGLPGLDIRLWKGSEPPELNGKKLKLAEHEEPVSLAIAPNRRSFFIGTGWRLYHFDAHGKERWRIEVPGGAKAVNVTKDSKIVVAALGDGTVRWYLARDGKPLLSFFPHRDRRRWVAWTPSGYYMASPGGDTLVGWHVNRGAESAADFFSVARFRHIYYRPDVVEKVLALRDEGEAVRKAEAGGHPKAPRDLAEILPPVVTVRALEDGGRIANPRLTLDITVRSPKGKPVVAIQVRAGGRPIASLEGDPAAPGGETRHRIPIYLPRHDTALEIIALSAGGVASEPAKLRLVWTGPRRQEKPRLYVLAVGVSKYRDPALRLELAAKDAADFAAILERQEGRAFGTVRVRILRDGEATRKNLRQGLDWLASAPGRRDVAVLFLAGHGVDDPSAGYFFLPYDAKRDAVAATGLSYTEIKRAMSRVSGRALLFVDTCRAGDVWGRPGEPSSDIDRIVNDLGSPEHGVIVFASSTGRQVSFESDAWGNGAFTKALVEGLGGRADVFGDDQVTVTTLDAYVANRVSKLTKGRQTPATGKPVGADFRLAVLR
ncbi:MAG: caspase family protein, partial [Alphaproteobacteria bacterium]